MTLINLAAAQARVVVGLWGNLWGAQLLHKAQTVQDSLPSVRLGGPRIYYRWWEKTPSVSARVSAWSVLHVASD